MSFFIIGKTETNTLSKAYDKISSEFISYNVASLTDIVLLCQAEERNLWGKRRLTDNCISK